MFRNVMRNRNIVYDIAIVLTLLVFEVFSGRTNYTAVLDITGKALWAWAIAIGVTGIDFAGLAKLLTPSWASDNNYPWWLFGAWFLSAIIDTALSVYAIMIGRLNMPTHPLVQSGLITQWMWTYGIPLVIAGVLFVIQHALVTRLNKMAGASSGGSYTPRKSNQPKYQPPPNQPKNNNRQASAQSTSRQSEDDAFAEMLAQINANHRDV
jgi:hypothetical protein